MTVFYKDKSHTDFYRSRWLVERLEPCERALFANELLEYLTGHRLSPRQAFILKHRLGWRCGSLTLDELSEVLSITPSRVREIEVHIYRAAKHAAIYGWFHPWQQVKRIRHKWSAPE